MTPAPIATAASITIQPTVNHCSRNASRISGARSGAGGAAKAADAQQSAVQQTSWLPLPGREGEACPRGIRWGVPLVKQTLSVSLDAGERWDGVPQIKNCETGNSVGCIGTVRVLFMG